MKRRHFTQFITLLSGGLALPALAASPSAFKMLDKNPGVAYLSRDFFEVRIGQKFKLAGEECRTLFLKSIENSCGEHCREQFRAVFEASPGNRLDEGIFRLERGFNDRFDLFLTKSTRGNGHQQLVAIINRQTHA
jgi:hypothetical protein